VTQTTATLEGFVDPNGFEVTACMIEYGTSTAYGKSAPCSSLPGAGTSSVAVSATVEGLTADTTYDYRVVATNSGGEDEGGNETFTTSEQAIVVPPSATQRLNELLWDVRNAPIPRNVRAQLATLVELSLRSIVTPCPWFFPFPTVWEEFRVLNAVSDLNLFIAVLEQSEHGRRPSVPPNLAKAGIEFAKEIQSLLLESIPVGIL
jgi:hypothetical protein